MRFLIVIGVLLCSLCLQVANAQNELPKHPRVAELEDKLSKDVGGVIKTRFPDIPYLIKITVDPLRRIGEGDAGVDKNLPYFNIKKEQDFDEWDDPEVPLSVLMTRTKSINVSVSMPEQIKDEDLLELKDGIFAAIHLIDGRDEVKIMRKAWKMNPFPWEYYAIFAGMLLTILVGLFLIARSISAKLAKSLSETRSAMNVPMGMSGNAQASSTSQNISIKSQGSSVDPWKAKDVSENLVEKLLSSPCFPTLNDMLILDECALNDSLKLGSVVEAFPKDVQDKLYSYSNKISWADALSSMSVINENTVEMLLKLNQYMRHDLNPAWEDLLIVVWRLEQKMPEFFKSIDKKEAVSILLALPKSISVPMAKATFPGSWGFILEDEFTVETISPPRIKELRGLAIKILPLTESSSLKRYRIEKELLLFLQRANPTEEKEIYQSISKSSKIHQMRPPFYRLFEERDLVVQKILEEISLDEWIVALYDLSVEQRKKVVQFFSEKQRFLFEERSLQLNNSAIDREYMGVVREKIGRLIPEVLSKMDSGVMQEQV